METESLKLERLGGKISETPPLNILRALISVAETVIASDEIPLLLHPWLHYSEVLKSCHCLFCRSSRIYRGNHTFLTLTAFQISAMIILILQDCGGVLVFGYLLHQGCHGKVGTKY